VKSGIQCCILSFTTYAKAVRMGTQRAQIGSTVLMGNFLQDFNDCLKLPGIDFLEVLEFGFKLAARRGYFGKNYCNKDSILEGSHLFRNWLLKYYNTLDKPPDLIF
jgi:hypothetical protein